MPASVDSAAGSGDAPSDAPDVQKDPLLEAFEAQHAAVQADPGDFNKLVGLISAADKLGDIAKLREVYDGFFAEYPLCFGYWKKYADAENRYTSPEAAVAVYERGVAAIPYSVDLWGHFASFKQTIGASTEDVQSIFERGLNFVGGDYAGYGLWSKYITFTARQESTKAAAQIYSRALGQPLKDLDKCFNSLKEFVSQHTVDEVVPPEEKAGLEAQAKSKKEAAAAAQQKAAEDAAAAAAKAAQEAAEQAEIAAAASVETPPAPMALDGPSTPGAEPQRSADEVPAAAPQTPPPTASGAPQDATTSAEHAVMPPPESAPSEPQGSDGEQSNAMPGGASADAAAAGAAAAEQAAAEAPAPVDMTVREDDVKEAWLANCQAIYEASKEEVGRRKAFEDAIKRPYFHVKPLDGAQLLAWSRYLDYAEERGDNTITTHLYERCLVACAQYHDFWARYIRFLEPERPDAAKEALRRAQHIHCKAQPELQLLAARFHERHGDPAAARTAYELVVSRLAPGLISAVLAFANFERRQGNKAAACKIYDDAVAAAADKGSSSEKTYAFLVVSYAHFLVQSFKDVDAARSLYASALQQAPGSLSLWEGAIHLEENLDAPGEEKARRALALYARAAGSDTVLSEAEREDFSARAAVAADLHGTAQMVEIAERLHCARFRPTEKLTQPPSSSSRPSSGQKRPADATAAGASPASKQARPADASASAAMSAAYPAASYPPAVPVAPVAGGPAAAPAAAAAPAYYGQTVAYPGYAGYYAPYPQPAYPTYSYPQY
ncbi:g6442 [Coccomyxa elongata]